MNAQIIADSIAPNGVRLTTMKLRYPRFIHAEVMTHRVFSRNASSSRAIPVMKMLAQVWNDPATPIHWGKNQAGMQTKGQLTGIKRALARGLWKWAGRAACGFAYAMVRVGLHKQVANRVLEPWQFIHVVLSATDWDNFFELRIHPDAQPEIQDLARMMNLAMAASTPKPLAVGEWHLPFVTEEELEYSDRWPKMGHEWKAYAKVSAARACRVSYLKHDGSAATFEEDIELCARLAGARPIHASPFEHQATPAHSASAKSGNFRGWIQHRELVEAEV